MMMPQSVINFGIKDLTKDFINLCNVIVTDSISDDFDNGKWCLLDVLVACAVVDSIWDMGHEFWINRDCYELPTWGYGSMGNTAEEWLAAYMDNDFSWTDDEWVEYTEWDCSDSIFDFNSSRKQWAYNIMMQPAIICDFDGEYDELPMHWICAEG